MKSIELKGEVREKTGKKQSQAAREEGLVPCIMYGGDQIIHFLVEGRIIHKLTHTPEVYIFEVVINDVKHNAVIQDIQFHPVTDNILHVDFIEIFDDKEVTVKLPIKLVGNSIGIKNGGKLRIRRRNLKARALPQNLPETLDIDITEINIGESVKVQDLNFDNITLLDPPRAMVMGVVSSRISKSMLPTEEETEAEEAAAEEDAEQTPEEKPSES